MIDVYPALDSVKMKSCMCMALGYESRSNECSSASPWEQICHSHMPTTTCLSARILLDSGLAHQSCQITLMLPSEPLRLSKPCPAHLPYSVCQRALSMAHVLMACGHKDTLQWLVALFFDRQDARKRHLCLLQTALPCPLGTADWMSKNARCQ